MLSFGELGILITIILINLIPFISPSNLVLAGIFALIFSDYSPIVIAVLIAAGASLAKLVHYLVSYYLGDKLAYRINGSVNKYHQHILNKWGSLGAFIAAVSPIPDDPIVIPMGLLRFSITKFFLAYFIGKIIIGFIGAYLAVQLSTMKVLDPMNAIISVIAILIILSLITQTKYFIYGKKIVYSIPIMKNVVRYTKNALKKLFKNTNKRSK